MAEVAEVVVAGMAAVVEVLEAHSEGREEVHSKRPGSQRIPTKAPSMDWLVETSKSKTVLSLAKRTI